MRCVVQSPLLRTQLSMQGLASLRRRPRAIVLGIGLSSRQGLSQGLPFDVLSMLLAAEQLRRATDAERVVALIADRHSLSNGFSASAVARRAQHVEQQLEHVRRALALPLELVRAEAVHARSEHRAILAGLREPAQHVHPYVALEVADTEYLRRRHGAILKLGWSCAHKPQPSARWLDERYFDACFRDWVGGEVGFAYALPGRTLDPRRPWAAPYLAEDPSARLLLSEHELHGHKLRLFLERAPLGARQTLLAHLRRITGVYHRAFARLSGSVVERVDGVLAQLYAGYPVRMAR